MHKEDRAKQRSGVRGDRPPGAGLRGFTRNMTEPKLMLYQVATGRFMDAAGPLLYRCYSGKFGPARDNPDAEAEPNRGPIPRGRWMMGKPYNSAKVGPLAIPLLPAAETSTFGRSAFLIHGDNAAGDASEGCIVAPRPLRHMLAAHLERGGEVCLYVI